jgi:RNA polymerase sigma factor (TIGR02999 family)
LALSQSVILYDMSEVTLILSAIEQGDPHAAEQLLPLVYQELRALAAQRLAQEKPGQTLQATALVHEAYLRLVDGDKAPHWNSRAHFFGACAEAMRRILVDQARRKQADKRGGRGRRVPLEAADVSFTSSADELLDIDEALTRLAAEDAQAARLIQLRYFAGLSIEDAAEVVGVSRSTAYEHWSYARARLRTLLDGE